MRDTLGPSNPHLSRAWRRLCAAALMVLPACRAHTGDTPPPPIANALEAGADEGGPALAPDTVRPLLEAELARAGLSADRLDLEAAERTVAGRGRKLDDPFRLRWTRELRLRPVAVPAAADALRRELDLALRGPTPVASALELAASRLEVALPPERERPPGSGWTRLAAAAGAKTPPDCPPELAGPLDEVFHGLADALLARAAMVRQSEAHDPQWWYANGGGHFLAVGASELPDPADPEVRSYLQSAARARLYAAAISLARAVERTDWSTLRGQEGLAWSVTLPAGRVRVHDAADHVHEDDGVADLLLVDLGGDDRYLGPVGANRGGDHPVALAVDLGGSDTYGYAHPEDLYVDPRLMPEDAEGRKAADARRGPISLSTTSRQGAAKNGIALLFDLGAGDDVYESLRASQGYAHQGVGVLFDAGGDDLYGAESAAQGCAQYGIALAIDLGEGDDQRRAYRFSQGAALVAGFGLLYDDGGDDAYTCHHGDPEDGGLPLYFSPQLPGKGNTSFCQGAATGLRVGRRGPEWHLSGGVGVLRDAGGEDFYEVSVFGQGVGYWQGAGLLLDGGGDDVYDGRWYAQGAAAHHALGVLVDGGGDDLYQSERAAVQMTLGAGHDLSSGVFLEYGGDDAYEVARLSAGAANCAGVGLFVEAAGEDRYLRADPLSAAVGHVSPECASARADWTTTGVFVDVAGQDGYRDAFAEAADGDGALPPGPACPDRPGSGRRWGCRAQALPGEAALGADLSTDEDDALEEADGASR